MVSRGWKGLTNYGLRAAASPRLVFCPFRHRCINPLKQESISYTATAKWVIEVSVIVSDIITQ